MMATRDYNLSDDDEEHEYINDGFGDIHPVGQNLALSNLEARTDEPKRTMFDDETTRCLDDLTAFDFPFTFTFISIEKKFGENVAVNVSMAVLDRFGFNMMRHPAFGVCIHDLPIECKKRIARIVSG